MASVILAGTWVAAVVGGVATTRIANAGTRDPEPLFTASLVMPSVGIALLAPLTLQLPFVIALGDASEFGEWARLSLIITGATHLVFAALVAARAWRLVAGRPAPGPGLIYATCVAVSCVPFAVLYLIPPALVAITGVPLIKLMRSMETLVERERERARDGDLPRATALQGA